MSRFMKGLIGIPLHLLCLYYCFDAVHSQWMANEVAFARDPKAAFWQMAEFPNFIVPSLVALGFIIGISAPPQTGLDPWDRVIRSQALRLMTASLLVALGLVLCGGIRWGRPSFAAVIFSLPCIAIFIGAGLWLTFAKRGTDGIGIIRHFSDVPNPALDASAQIPEPHVSSFVRVIKLIAVIAVLFVLSFVAVGIFSLMKLRGA